MVYEIWFLVKCTSDIYLIIVLIVGSSTDLETLQNLESMNQESDQDTKEFPFWKILEPKRKYYYAYKNHIFLFNFQHCHYYNSFMIIKQYKSYYFST